MQQEVLISICVPAYKRTDFLKRLLDSIVDQTFTDFEVIITDDSPGSDVEELCGIYKRKIELVYCRNQEQLGTPENWNEAIRRARGEWIKLMHDDDWFAFPNSLQKLVELTKLSKECSFVFCGSSSIENSKVFLTTKLGPFRRRLLKKDPANLFSRNCIGPPSVVMHRKNAGIRYDSRMKWLVDVDFYIRYLRLYSFNFTREYLVNVGFSEEQVTQMVFSDPEVVIPENLLLMSKLEPKVFLRIWNYDFCWRLMRNYHILDAKTLYKYSQVWEGVTVPLPLLHIVKGQRLIPTPLLKIGAISKIFMMVNYLSFLMKKQWKPR